MHTVRARGVNAQVHLHKAGQWGRHTVHDGRHVHVFTYKVLSAIHGRGCESTTFTYKSFQFPMVERESTTFAYSDTSMVE
eukprot:913285-Prorocentrum_lima.AAC.1